MKVSMLILIMSKLIEILVVRAALEIMPVWSMVKNQYRAIPDQEVLFQEQRMKIKTTNIPHTRKLAKSINNMA